MNTIESKDWLKTLAKNSENSPTLICMKDGVLTYKSFIESVGAGRNLDEIIASGNYRLSGDCYPLPTGVTSQGCVLTVFWWDANRVYQELIALGSRFYRHKTSAGWTNWIQFATVS